MQIILHTHMHPHAHTHTHTHTHTHSNDGSSIAVIVVSLVVQNGLVVISSLVLVAMFVFNWTVCTQLVPFAILFIAVILLGAVANLATIANTISIERDWIVVLADGNSDTLASELGPVNLALSPGRFEY